MNPNHDDKGRFAEGGKGTIAKPHFEPHALGGHSVVINGQVVGRVKKNSGGVSSAAQDAYDRRGTGAGAWSAFDASGRRLTSAAPDRKAAIRRLPLPPAAPKSAPSKMAIASAKSEIRKHKPFYMPE